MKSLLKEKLYSFFIIIFSFFTIKRGRSIYWIDILFMLITLILMKKDKIKLNKYLGFFLIGYVALVTFNFINTRIVEIEYFLDYIIYSYITFLILSQMELKEKIYKNYLFIFSVFTLIFTVKYAISWYEAGFKPNYRSFARGYPTIASIETGIYVLICFISTIYSKKIFEKVISFICFFISIIALISVNSRNSLMTIPIIILGILILKYRKKLKIKYFIGIIVITGILFQQLDIDRYFYRVEKTLKIENLKRDDRYFYRVEKTLKIENLKRESRIRIWKYGIEKFKENDYKSLGYRYFEGNKIKIIPNEENPHLHNTFLEILVTQGYLALIFYISFNIFLLKEMVKKIKTTEIESQKIMNYLTISILIFYNVSGLVDANIYFKKVNLLVYFLYALALCNVVKDES